MAGGIGKTPASRAFLYNGNSRLYFIKERDSLFNETQIKVVIDLLVELDTSLRVISNRLHE